MAGRDVIYYSDVAPTVGTEFIRPIWFVEDANDIYVWSPGPDMYVLYVPDLVVAPQPDASPSVKGLLKTASNVDTATGTAEDLAVTPSGLKSVLTTLKGTPPLTLQTLGALALAIGNDPVYSQTIEAALLLKADADGANVVSPDLSDVSTALTSTSFIQDLLVDTGVSPTNVVDALAALVVLGATNTAGSQRFLTLPTLDQYLSQQERTCAGILGGSSFTLAIDDELILLDGSIGAPTLVFGNPVLFKKRPYYVCNVNPVFPPVLSFPIAYPMADGGTSLTLTNMGRLLTIIPTSLGRWAVA